jgi:hypothetical protein
MWSPIVQPPQPANEYLGLQKIQRYNDEYKKKPIPQKILDCTAYESRMNEGILWK